MSKIQNNAATQQNLLSQLLTQQQQQTPLQQHPQLQQQIPISNDMLRNLLLAAFLGNEMNTATNTAQVQTPKQSPPTATGGTANDGDTKCQQQPSGYRNKRKYSAFRSQKSKWTNTYSDWRFQHGTKSAGCNPKTRRRSPGTRNQTAFWSQEVTLEFKSLSFAHRFSFSMIVGKWARISGGFVIELSGGPFFP